MVVSWELSKQERTDTIKTNSFDMTGKIPYAVVICQNRSLFLRTKLLLSQ